MSAAVEKLLEQYMAHQDALKVIEDVEKMNKCGKEIEAKSIILAALRAEYQATLTGVTPANIMERLEKRTSLRKRIAECQESIAELQDRMADFNTLTEKLARPSRKELNTARLAVVKELDTHLAKLQTGYDFWRMELVNNNVYVATLQRAEYVSKSGDRTTVVYVQNGQGKSISWNCSYAEAFSVEDDGWVSPVVVLPRIPGTTLETSNRVISSLLDKRVVFP